jgi:hypothetical protein
VSRGWQCSIGFLKLWGKISSKNQSNGVSNYGISPTKNISPSNRQCIWLNRLEGVSIPYAMGFNFGGGLALKIYVNRIGFGF